MTASVAACAAVARRGVNNNDLFQASRRRFLAQLGGLTVAGML
ncbi:hypothetical protein ACUOA5_45885, partial [Escherichia coli]